MTNFLETDRLVRVPAAGGAQPRCGRTRLPVEPGGVGARLRHRRLQGPDPQGVHGSGRRAGHGEHNGRQHSVTSCHGEVGPVLRPDFTGDWPEVIEGSSTVESSTNSPGPSGNSLGRRQRPRSQHLTIPHVPSPSDPMAHPVASTEPSGRSELCQRLAGRHGPYRDTRGRPGASTVRRRARRRGLRRAGMRTRDHGCRPRPPVPGECAPEQCGHLRPAGCRGRTGSGQAGQERGEPRSGGGQGRVGVAGQAHDPAVVEELGEHRRAGRGRSALRGGRLSGELLPERRASTAIHMTPRSSAATGKVHQVGPR